MRFGFATVPTDPHPAHVKLIQAAESMGYDMAWVPDQTFHRDPYAVLAAAALATHRIGLGIGTTNPYTRHPVVTARVAATVNELSGGRLVLGYGAGNRKEMLDLMGFGHREAQRCREAVLVTKQLLAGERVHHRSDTLRLDDIALECAPVRPLPVYLAGRGPRILAAAGEVADGVIIGALVSEAGLRYALDLVAKGARQSQRTLEKFEVVSWVNCLVTEEKSTVANRLRPMVAHVIGGAPETTLHAIGLPEDLIARLKDAYRTGGPRGAAPLVPEEIIHQLALVGDPGELAERIRTLQASGVHQLVVLMPSHAREGSHGIGPFDHHQNLRRFAEEVMPRV